MRLGAVGAVYLGQAVPAGEAVAPGGRRVVAQGRILVEPVRHVDAEAGDPPVEPEPQDRVELGVHGRLPPVQVRLAGQEVVQVVLAAGVVEGPGGGAGVVQPIVGGPAAGRRVGPHVVAAVRRSPARPGVHEPGVGAAGVVGHQVQQYPHAPLARLRHQLVKVVHGAELGMDGQVVRDVVAPVVIGGGHRRRQPDAVHPQPRQVVEPGDHPPQVAVPVPVAVPPGADVDLVQGGPVPPAGFRLWRVHHSPGCGQRPTRAAAGQGLHRMR